MTSVLSNPLLERSSTIGQTRRRDPDVDADMIDLVRRRGYPLEEHFVTTKDGYILSLFRIPHGKDESTTSDQKRPAALLVHGLLDSSVVWVNNLDQSLGFVLADEGYDVFMLNNRGNRWSSRHVELTKANPKFWEFSYDEMGAYDVPATIEFVLELTGHQSVAQYVGHSQGTTQMIAALTQPELRNYLAPRIDVFVGLAPVAYIRHETSALMRAMADLHLDELTKLLGVHEFAPDNIIFETVLPKLCEASNLACANLLEAVYGKSTKLNETRTDVFLSQFPSGTSVTNVMHWAQSVESNFFGKFDYGRKKNLAKYGTRRPPTYDLGNYPVDLVTKLYCGTKDALADMRDVHAMVAQIPKAASLTVVEVDDFAHVDFVWAKTAGKLYREAFGLQKNKGNLRGSDKGEPNPNAFMAYVAALF